MRCGKCESCIHPRWKKACWGNPDLELGEEEKKEMGKEKREKLTDPEKMTDTVENFAEKLATTAVAEKLTASTTSTAPEFAEKLTIAATVVRKLTATKKLTAARKKEPLGEKKRTDKKKTLRCYRCDSYCTPQLKKACEDPQ